MKIVSSSALAFALLAGAVVLVPAAASAEVPRVGSTTPIAVNPGAGFGLMELASIPLGCSGSGSSDVVSRNHSIKNIAGHPIPKGTVLSWSASNKGSGHLTLTSDLAPNASVEVIVPGQTNGYTCTASFIAPNVDLVLKSVHWTSDTTASIVIANASPWRDAGASTLKVDRMKCFSSLVSTSETATPAIPKGGSTTVTVTVAKAGADYLQATANATNAVTETSTANNAGKSPEFGTNKSCTPQ